MRRASRLTGYLVVGATLAGYFLVSALRARLGAKEESVFAWIP